MTSDEQLKKWVEGESIHNEKKGECCPDFSCCQLELQEDRETRERFAKAIEEHDDKTRDAMLISFLGKAIASYKSEKKAYIAGDSANYEKIQ